MENTNFFIEKIQEVIKEYLQDLRQPSNQHITFVPVIDMKDLHFQIIGYGWENNRRMFNMLFHLDIIKDKIWIQEDKMEYSIAERLLEKGLDKQQIVLAYIPNHLRQYTEYAIQ